MTFASGPFHHAVPLVFPLPPPVAVAAAVLVRGRGIDSGSKGGMTVAFAELSACGGAGETFGWVSGPWVWADDPPLLNGTFKPIGESVRESGEGEVVSTWAWEVAAITKPKQQTRTVVREFL